MKPARRANHAVLRASSLIAIGFVLSGAPAGGDEPATFTWESLPPIPDAEGFAAPFAGVSNDALVVAGGANFPDKKPWEGGAKVWYDAVFTLSDPQGQWQQAGLLPRPIAYGVSLTTDRGVACLGGSDSQRHYADCFLLTVENGKASTEPLPSLPVPLANACGAQLGDTIYVAGGIDRPDAARPTGGFLSLDLKRPEEGWRELESWPGPPRMLATMGAQGGSLYLFSGADLRPGSDGAPRREWLRDAYRYTPGEGWSRVADLPRPSVAAPTPAPAVGQSHLMLLGGDDGSQLNVDPEAHPGFPRAPLAYHTITDTWTSLKDAPFSLVTTPTVFWRGRIIVPGGERQPGIRSNAVWSADPIRRKAPFGWINYATLTAYLLAMVGIGWVCASRNKNTDDYFKASGRIPWWAAGLSIYATMLSSLTFMALPAKAFATNWTYFWANVPILLLAPIVIRYYLPFFRRLEVTTAYEYLELRFNLVTRLYASAAFIAFQLGRQAIVLLLPSLALATVCDLDVRLCVLIMGALCAAYTVMGGIEAVIWTDVVQSIVLLGGALVSLAVILWSIGGGVGEFWEVAQSNNKLHMINWTLDPSLASNAFWVIIVGNLFANLVPYTSDQAVVQRYLTTHDERQAGRAIWSNALLAVPSTLLFFTIGTALFVFYHSHPERIDPVNPTDAIFPSFIVRNLPVGVAGIVIAGIFAAAQSTVSSSLNSVVTALMTDFYHRFGGSRDETHSLRLARLLTAVNGVFATGAALVLVDLDVASLWDAYFSLVGLTGSGLAGLFALGIFTRRATGVGAVTGAVASAAVLYWLQQNTDAHFFLYAMVGSVTCFVVGWTVSVLLPTPIKPLANLTIYDQARL